jgi:hypothetical protein
MERSHGHTEVKSFAFACISVIQNRMKDVGRISVCIYNSSLTQKCFQPFTSLVIGV